MGLLLECFGDGYAMRHLRAWIESHSRGLRDPVAGRLWYILKRWNVSCANSSPEVSVDGWKSVCIPLGN